MVFNPLHSEMKNVPIPFSLIKRGNWSDGTCVKIINREKSYNYWIEAWREELTLSYKK